jgi:hypothetical protein
LYYMKSGKKENNAWKGQQTNIVYCIYWAASTTPGGQGYKGKLR